VREITSRVRISDARLRLVKLDGLAGQSARRFDEILQRFELFARNGFDIESLGDLTAVHVEQCTEQGFLPGFVHVPARARGGRWEMFGPQVRRHA
jgi:hypothetical protein